MISVKLRGTVEEFETNDLVDDAIAELVEALQEENPDFNIDDLEIIIN